MYCISPLWKLHLSSLTATQPVAVQRMVAKQVGVQWFEHWEFQVGRTLKPKPRLPESEYESQSSNEDKLREYRDNLHVCGLLWVERRGISRNQFAFWRKSTASAPETRKASPRTEMSVARKPRRSLAAASSDLCYSCSGLIGIGSYVFFSTGGRQTLNPTLPWPGVDTLWDRQMEKNKVDERLHTNS